MFSALHRIFESHLQNTFDFRTSIIVCIIRLIIILVLFTEIHTSGQLTDTDKIGILYQLRTQRRFVDQAFECLYRTDISEKTQFLTHSQQTLLRTYLGSRIIVKFRITYGREQNSIRLFTNLISCFRKRIAYFINRISSTDCIFVTYFVTKLLANGTHHIYTLHRDLRSDAVAC